MLVYNTPDREHAWIIRSTLQSEGINVVLMDKTSSPYTHQVFSGELELYVHTQQAERALDIIYGIDEEN